MPSQVVLIEAYDDLRGLLAEHLVVSGFTVTVYASIQAWQAALDGQWAPVIIVDQTQYGQHCERLACAGRDGAHLVMLAHTLAGVPPVREPDSVFMKPFRPEALSEHIRRVLTAAG